MADDGIMKTFQDLHRDLTTVADILKEDREDQGRLALSQLPDNPHLGAVADRFQRLLEKPGRKKESRDSVMSGKVQFDDEVWSLNKEIQEIILQVADDIDLDEIEAARLTILAEDEEKKLRRPRKQCAIIRFHQQRRYMLWCMLLLLELSKEEDELLADDDYGGLGRLGQYVNYSILRVNIPGAVNNGAGQRFVPACATALSDIRSWLQKLSEQMNAAIMLGRATDLQSQEIFEFVQISLQQQHELLAVILCYAIEKHAAVENDFVSFLHDLRLANRYDYSIVHLLPVLGTYITIFGSTEGHGSIEQARKLNTLICRQSESTARPLPFLDAAVKAWWIAEYSGWYMEDAAGSGLTSIDLDQEDIQRSKQFVEALKDGAFDFLLVVMLDAKSTEWQDPSQAKLRAWVQKRTPSLPPDTVPFSTKLQGRITAKMEMLVDAFISNMPDLLRKLKIEEDEQRQAGHHQQQDLDLERFLLMVAYSYEGRPEAADAFWADPESNLAGFLQWASRRTTTPLQTAFCEMLQCLADDSGSATYAHEFLLDEGHQLRRPSSITWAHIIKEMEYYINKIRAKPAGPQVTAIRAAKLDSEQAENELEMTMLQEAYLRLITKVALQSEAGRLYLLQMPNERLVVLLFQAISSAVSHQIKAHSFRALSALMSRKSLLQSYTMWNMFESCFTGFYISPAMSARTQASTAAPPHPPFFMEALLEEMSTNFDETTSFIQLSTVLTSLPDEIGPLNDALPYPENLGSSSRTRPGIEPYIDFILGHIFSAKVPEYGDITQKRILRYHCLDFALTCVSTFNEDLIVLGNDSSINVDSAIRTRDLEAYVSLHPYARVMEWMYDSKFMAGILDTIHQSPSDIGKAAPDSPLILGVQRAIELLSKVLDLQATFLDVVRPIVKPQYATQSRSTYTPSSNGVFASIEDGLITSLTLVSDLGSYCGIGHPNVTLASLKLLEKISTSPRIISAWQSGPLNQTYRNKAIVVLEEHGDAQAIAGAFYAELTFPLGPTRPTESPDYHVKVAILDFLHACLKASPDRPTIAHVLLGFHCSANTLEMEPGSAFDRQTSLFHALLQIILETPINNDEETMQWLVGLKYKVMRIFKLLWSSSLSANLVLAVLRENDFLFHILLRGLVTQQSSRWDGQEPSGPDFLTTPAAEGFVDYIAMRAMALEYVALELCKVAQGQVPALKRRIFDALGGQIVIEGMESIQVPSVFEFHDSLPQEELFAAPVSALNALADLDLQACLEVDDDSNPIYNLSRVQEVLLLKRNEDTQSGQLIILQDAAQMDMEEELVLSYAMHSNRLSQIQAYSLKIVRAWTRLLMVMTDCNDFTGTNKVSFVLQTLQAILPGLDKFGSEKPGPALELAKLAKVLLFRLDFVTMNSADDKESRAVENLISDKLFHLFKLCLNAIAKWVGDQELRATYYSICYRYLTGLLDSGLGALSGLRRTTKTIQSFGEKLLNVVCDDAFGGDAGSQSTALIFLTTLVQLGKEEDDNYVVETLNRLNFIGILVDSLRDVLQEWIGASHAGNSEYQNYLDAKLALLLQLCQTREGAKHVLHANIFRTIELSKLFAVDPELQVESTDSRALEQHYLLLVKVARILSVALVSRGSHNILQGRRFLTEHRMLVMHVLKLSAGVGAGASHMDPVLSRRVHDLAEAIMVMIMATGFLEFENQTLAEDPSSASTLFH